jgi:hypothetical protein
LHLFLPTSPKQLTRSDNHRLSSLCSSVPLSCIFLCCPSLRPAANVTLFKQLDWHLQSYRL